MKKRFLPFALIACLAATALPLTACTDTQEENVLRIASWDEYIDEGGADSYVEGSRALYEEFEDWYFEQTGKRITVDYVPLQDNETMYNKIKMGDRYDLLCPSEYMIMKLAAEDMIQKLPSSFFDPSLDNNYYVRNVSDYIQKEVFERTEMTDGSKLSEYTAGYMWGSTGFVYNPEKISADEVKRWSVLTNEAYVRKITAKDNVRDSYFAGLGMYYEAELLALKTRLNDGAITLESYKKQLSEKMNDSSVGTMSEVQKLLEKMRGNLYGLETDEGKLDIVTGRFDVSYQWSGDAVYTLDMGEDDEITDEPLALEYCIPEAASNLWFDGWVLMKDANVDAATAFINFLSIPENVVRNMYYIGYTSCIAGDEVFSYVEETYGADETEEAPVSYDLSYFFGDGHQLLTSEDQTRRQLFAQYPTRDTIDRLVVMKPFDRETNERANRMWNTIK
ncbi:MAG: extracellular solute-binding protein [Clostridia bacterium]|nr:extracellular solute-binding protein [Clostridia bacterium]